MKQKEFLMFSNVLLKSRLIAVFTLLFNVLTVRAYDFQYLGVFYTITDQNELLVSVSKGNVTYQGKVTIPESVDYNGEKYRVVGVDNEAFMGSDVTTVTIPNSVTKFGFDVFGGCTSLKSVSIGNGIKEIPWICFSGCTNLEKVVLGKNVEIIGQHAFNGCTSLTSINMENLVTIEDRSFLNCSALPEVLIGSKMKEIKGEAFNGCTSLSKLTILEGVENIGTEAFMGCTSLTTVTIPNSVKNLDGGIFTGCTSLKSVGIGNGIKEIPWICFSGCTNLEKVTLGKNVEIIGQHAFNGCTSLTSINMENLVTIEDRSFLNCSALPEVLIGSKMKEIKGEAFNGCTSLRKLTILEGVEKIGMEAFMGCTSLTSVKIPNSVKDLVGGTFLGCSSLETAVLGGGLSEVPWICFSGCSNLKSITIPSGITSIDRSAFNGCTAIKIVISASKNPCTFDKSTFTDDVYANATLFVPTETEMSYRGTEAWKRFYKIYEFDSRSVEIIDFADPEVKKLCVANWDTNGDGELSIAEAVEVTDLGAVFKSNTKIKSFSELQYFKGLKTIGTDAFQGCRSLSSFVIPNSVTTIGVRAFQYCAITTFDIPSSVTTIEEYAFSYCANLTTAVIPPTVTLIKSNLFADTNLLSISVDVNNPVYDSRNNCNAIIETSTMTLKSGCKNTKIPYGIKVIGGYAFSGCEDLISVDLPNTVTELDFYAFGWCSNLASIYVPASLTSISRLSFSCCNNLDHISVAEDNPKYDSRGNCNAVIETATNKLVVGSNLTVIPESVTAIADNAFDGRAKIKTIDVPESVKSIGRGAFDGCVSMKSIKIPSTFTSIGGSTFFSCSSLASFDIPASITSIGDYAFAYCDDLLRVRCLHETPYEIHEDAFYRISPSATLYVPKGSKEKYAAAKGWNVFKNIVEINDRYSLPGDADGNNVRNTKDIKAIESFIMTGIETNDFYWWNADTDQNGEVNAADIVTIVNMMNK